MQLKARGGSGGGGAWGYWLLALVLGGGIIYVISRNSQLGPQSPSPQPATPAMFQRTSRVTPLPPPAPTNAVEGLNLRNVRTLLEAQVALAREGICSGSIDGALGSQTRAALRAYQRREKLPVTGELDAATKARLTVEPPVLAPYVVTAADLARLQPLSSTWLGKSQQSALDYADITELLCEKGHTHPALLRKLNPGLNWTNLTPGTAVDLPRVAYPEPRRATWLRIRLAEKTLEAFDAQTNLLAHFPCSIAARVEKRPTGELRVKVIAPNPNYTFDPEVFPESEEGRKLGRKLILPPGPNNPVGVAWIGLDLPGYGIHGTPQPENVGRTESHGCFRLANWNAEYLARMVVVGTKVVVEP